MCDKAGDIILVVPKASVKRGRAQIRSKVMDVFLISPLYKKIFMKVIVVD